MSAIAQQVLVARVIVTATDTGSIAWDSGASPEKEHNMEKVRAQVLGAIKAEHPLEAIAKPIVTTLSGKAFPCTFVRAALADGMLQLAHIDLADNDHVDQAHELISSYLEDVRVAGELSERLAAMKVLLLDVEIPQVTSAQEVRDLAWGLLTRLHTLDRELGNAWPRDIPGDMNDARWAYCLEETPIFVNMTSSTLELRRSRNLGRPLILVIQPTDGLHYIAPLNAVGDRIRDTIRDRIDAYDGVLHSPALTNFGEDGNSDWSQFFFTDSNSQSTWFPPQIPARFDELAQAS